MTESTFRERASGENRQLYDQAVRLIKGGEPVKAETLLHAIIETESGFAPAYNKLGVIQMGRRKRQAAYEWFMLALEADPDYPPALTNVGNFLFESGRRVQAMAYYRRAIDVDNAYGPAHNGLGLVLRGDGRLTEAVRHLKMARRRLAYHVDEGCWSGPGA